MPPTATSSSADAGSWKPRSGTSALDRTAASEGERFAAEWIAEALRAEACVY